MADIIETEVEVFTRYKRPKKTPEVNSGEIVTEAAGYIPADVQIQDMIAAGVRLGEYRREMYDFAADEEVPEDFIDPSRSPRADPVEVEAAGLAVTEKIALAQKLLEQAEAERKAEEEKKAEEAAK